MKKILIGIIAVSVLVGGALATKKTEKKVLKRGTKIEWSNYLFADDFDINNEGRGDIYFENRKVDNFKVWHTNTDLNNIMKNRELTIEKKKVFNCVYSVQYKFGKSILEELKEELKRGF